MTVPDSVIVTRPADRSRARWCLIVGLERSSCWAISREVEVPPGEQLQDPQAGLVAERPVEPHDRLRRGERVARLERVVRDRVAEQSPVGGVHQEVVGPREVAGGEDHPPDARLGQPADAAASSAR